MRADFSVFVALNHIANVDVVEVVHRDANQILTSLASYEIPGIDLDTVR